MANCGDDMSLRDLLHSVEDDLEGSCVMNKVMKDIFSSCDTEQSGLVLVSKLVEFIMPFLQDNSDALKELKLALDPENRNRLIDSATFFEAMSVWTTKLSHGEEMGDCNFHDVTPRDLDKLDEKDLPFLQSTPRSSFGQHLLKGYVESEDQIHELEHQKRKVIEELSRVRAELANTVDQNETLQADLNRVTKRLANEQKINDQLQKEREKDEEYEENLSLAQKQIAKLEKSVGLLEKANNQLKQELEDANLEKQNLEGKISTMTKKHEEMVSTIVALQTEVTVREQEISSMEQVHAALREKLDQQQHVIEQCNINNDRLKVEKATLEKLLRERVTKNDSFLNLNKPPSHSNSFNQSSPDVTGELSQTSSHNESLVMQDSSEDDIYYKMQMMASSQGEVHHESLQSEMTQAIINTTDIEHECDHNIKLIEAEHRILNLQFELMQHQNCNLIIDRHKEERDHLKQQCSDCHETIEQLKAELADFKTQLSLSEDEKKMLHEKCRDLEQNYNNSMTYITEIRVKLSDRDTLGSRCRELQEKAEGLEAENSMKYITIVELTMEIDKLRQELDQSDSRAHHDLSDRLLALEGEKGALERERANLVVQLGLLNNENVKLKLYNDNLATELADAKCNRRESQQNVENLAAAKEAFERKCEDLICEKESLHAAKADLEAKMETLAGEKRSLQNEYLQLNARKKSLVREKQEFEHRAEKEKQKMVDEMQKLISEAGALKAELQEALKLKEGHDETSRQLRKACDEFNNLKANFETSEANRVAARDQWKEERGALLDKIEALTAETSALGAQNEKLKCDFQRKLDAYEEDRVKVEGANRGVFEEIDALRIKLNGAEMADKKRDIEMKRMSLELVDFKLSSDKAKLALELQEKANGRLSEDNELLKRSILAKEDTIAVLNREIEALQDMVDHLNVQVDAINSMMQEYSALNGNLQKQLLEKEESLRKCHAELAENARRISDLESDVKTYEGDLKTTKNMYNELQQNYSSTVANHDKLKKKLDLVTDENKALSNKLSEMQTIKVKLEQQVGRQVQKNNDFCNKLAGVEKELQEIKTDNKRIKDNHNRTVCEVQLLQKEKAALEMENHNLKRLKAELQTENSNLKTSNEKLKNDMSLLVEVKNNAAKENDRLLRENENRRRLLEDANSQVVEARRQMQAMERSISNTSLRMPKITFEDDLDRYRTDSARSQLEIDRLTKEKMLVVSQLRLRDAEISEMKQRMEDLLIEKEAWLTEKIQLSQKVQKEALGPDDGKTGAPEAKLPRKSGSFDRLAAKNLKLEQRIEGLEEELLKEKMEANCATAKFAQEKVTLEQQLKKAADERTRLESKVTKVEEEICLVESCKQQLLKENEELRAKLHDSHDDCLKLINQYSLMENVDASVRDDDGATDKDHKIKELEAKLADAEDSVQTLEHSLHQEHEKLKFISEHISAVRNGLNEKRVRLERSTVNSANLWRKTLEKFSDMDEFLETLDEGPPISPTWTFNGPLDEEMFQLKHQVYMTSVLLNNFSAIKKSLMQASDDRAVRSLIQSLDLDIYLPVPSSDFVKPVKKFTLRPATFVPQPPSPDSPSMHVLKENSFASTRPPPEVNNNQSPDSAGDNVPGSSGIAHAANNTDLSAFNESTLDYFDAQDLSLSNLSIYEEQEASPNLTNDVLEDLGLRGDNGSRRKLSEEEVQEKFTALVLAFTIDNASLRRRFQAQQNRLVGKENALAGEMAAWSALLREALSEELCADMLARMQNVLRMCTQISLSAVQFGALRHEKQLIKTVSLMVNYVAILKQKLELLSGQSQSTMSLQVIENTKPSEGQCNLSGKGIAFQQDVEERNLPVVPYRNENAEAVTKSVGKKNNGNSLLRNVTLSPRFVAVVFLSICMYYFMVLLNRKFCGNKSFSLPWNWAYWDDTLAPYVKLSYRNGPPPT